MVPVSARAVAEAPAKFTDYPFKLGVASGDPLPDGLVIWTRLMPIPFDPNGAGTAPITVRWQVAEDESFSEIAQSGAVIAYRENAHAVHAEVMGLRPERQYFYRFIAGGEESPKGRAFTLPEPGKHVAQFRFALASCQSFTDGYYAAYRDMVATDPRLIIHAGDYIYEQDWVGGMRRLPVPEALDLAGYRSLYAAYKLDPLLQGAHAAAPWLSIWDDHEVENDWGGDYSQDGLDPEAFMRRKAAAFKARFEHMPVRLGTRPIKGKVQLYQRSVVGDLLQFDLLDCRQFRDNPACMGNPRTFRSFTEMCDQATDGGRSMLGRQQESWLYRGLGTFGAKWNTLVQTTMLSPFDFAAGGTGAYDMDGWDGFSTSRQRLLDTIASKKISNPVSLGGNIHAYYTGVIGRQALDKGSKPLVSEIVGTSISSSGGGDDRHKNTLAQFGENPGSRFFDNRKRGYVLCDVSHKRWDNQFRVIEDVRDKNSKASTLATATIEDGIVDVNNS